MKSTSKEGSIIFYLLTLNQAKIFTIFNLDQKEALLGIVLAYTFKIANFASFFIFSFWFKREDKI